jgi:hypothetical protein
MMADSFLGYHDSDAVGFHQEPAAQEQQEQNRNGYLENDSGRNADR